ncbi:MAG: hypothetical protein KC503_42655 [Myxococcales bacterium]|nr:hypothetical protein [Myxococcales bacterium]
MRIQRNLFGRFGRARRRPTTWSHAAALLVELVAAPFVLVGVLPLLAVTLLVGVARRR